MIRKETSRPRHLMPGWTSMPLPTPHHLTDRLDDHALAPTPGHLQPPVHPAPHGLRVPGVHEQPPSRLQQPTPVVLDQPVDERELLVVRHRGETAAMDREDLEGASRTPSSLRRPAVAPVRLGERRRVSGLLPLLAEQLPGVDPDAPRPLRARPAPPGTPPRQRRRPPRTGCAATRTP